jgi:hypothetical protein
MRVEEVATSTLNVGDTILVTLPGASLSVQALCRYPLNDNSVIVRHSRRDHLIDDAPVSYIVKSDFISAIAAISREFPRSFIIKDKPAWIPRKRR